MNSKQLELTAHYLRIIELQESEIERLSKINKVQEERIANLQNQNKIYKENLLYWKKEYERLKAVNNINYTFKPFYT